MRLYDLHCHTYYSLCAARDSFAEDFVKYAEESDLAAIGFSDHAWDKGVGLPIPWYVQQPYERLYERKKPESGVKVLLGAEGEYAQGVLGVRPETASKLDYVIIPHSHTHMKGFVLPEGIENNNHAHGRYAFYSYISLLCHPDIKYIFGVAHPFSLCGKNAEEHEDILSAITDEEFECCGRLAAQKGIFLELNASSCVVWDIDKAENSQYARFFRNAKKGGAQFFLGSDNHRPVKPSENTLFKLPEYIKAFGLCEEDFTTALSHILRV